LREHPHLNAIVALNLQSGLAAFTAIHSQLNGRNVHLIVYDQSDELCILLRRGEIDSIVVQDMRGIGERAVLDIMADRRGTHTADTAFIAPVLVTRENIDNETIQHDLQLNVP
jgi:ribose transport system substrate-binding protein